MKDLLRLKIDSNRIYGLDILRAAAILFVVIRHGGYLLPKEARQLTSLIVFDGVSIFFVLSGFLIGGILLKSVQNKVDSSSLFDFWIRRWFRTLPNYFFVLLLLVCSHSLLSENFKISDVLRYFVFSQNLTTPHPSFFPEAWSLSIEEWFYLLIPLIIFTLIIVLKLSPPKAVMSVAIAVIVVVTFYRYLRFETITINSVNEWDIFFRKQVITRLDSLMYGLIGAYIKYYYAEEWKKYKLPLFIAGISTFILTKFLLPRYTDATGLYNCVFSFSTISAATLLLLPFLSSLKSGQGLIYKGITYISLTSYSMYLLNLSVIQHLIIRKIPWTILFKSNYLIVTGRYGLYWVLVIVLSILLYKYFELPMTKLREKKIFRDRWFRESTTN